MITQCGVSRARFQIFCRNWTMVRRLGTWKVGGDCAGLGSLRTPKTVGMLIVRESRSGCATS